MGVLWYLHIKVLIQNRDEWYFWVVYLKGVFFSIVEFQTFFCHPISPHDSRNLNSFLWWLLLPILYSKVQLLWGLGAGSPSRCENCLERLTIGSKGWLLRLQVCPSQNHHFSPGILTGWCIPEGMSSPYMLEAGSPNRYDTVLPWTHHQVQRMIVAPPRLPNPRPLFLVLHQIILTGWCTPEEIPSPYMSGAELLSR